MKRTITIFILLTGLLAKNYLIEVADEGGDQGGDEVADEGGLDYSLNRNLKMVLDGQFQWLLMSSSSIYKSLQTCLEV